MIGLGSDKNNLILTHIWAQGKTRFKLTSLQTKTDVLDPALGALLMIPSAGVGGRKFNHYGLLTSAREIFLP